MQSRNTDETCRKEMLKKSLPGTMLSVKTESLWSTSESNTPKPDPYSVCFLKNSAIMHIFMFITCIILRHLLFRSRVLFLNYYQINLTILDEKCNTVCLTSNLNGQQWEHGGKCHVREVKTDGGKGTAEIRRGSSLCVWGCVCVGGGGGGIKLKCGKHPLQFHFQSKNTNLTLT